MNKRLKSLTVEERDMLEEEGHELLHKFADLMGSEFNVETHVPLIQAHYEWAKKFVCTNKTSYSKYMATYVYDKPTRDSINSVKPGLAVYIHQTVVKNLNKITQ